MRWLFALPIRVSVPLAVVLSAVVALGLGYLGASASSEADFWVSAERSALDEMTTYQTALAIVVAEGDLIGARTMVAAFGSQHTVASMVLAGPDGTVLAATKLAWKDKPVDAVAPTFAAQRRRILRSAAPVEVSVRAEREAIVAHTRVCSAEFIGAESGSRCSTLGVEFDLGEGLRESQAALRRLAATSGLALLCFAALVGVFFEITVGRRAQRLLHAVARFTAGDETARTELSGRDELGRIGAAFDGLLASVLQGQRSLRESEERHRSILNQTELVVYTKDVDGRYLFVNRSFELLFDTSFAQVHGLTDYDILPTEAADAVVANDREVLAGEMPLEFEETVDLGGESRVFLSVKFPLTNIDGKVVALCGLSKDITARVEDEVRLRQAQKMEMVGQLTGGVAHDFNNLLAVIVPNLSMLAPLVHEAEGKEMLVAAQSAARRGAELVHRLLGLSRHEAHEPTTVEVAEAFEGVRLLLKRAVVANITIQADQSLHVFADATQLEVAIMNLVLNARDAAPDRQVNIRLAVTRVGAEVCISVSDDGCGMAADVVEHARDPFFSTKIVGAGTGLGLTMVQGFAERSGGRMEIESTVGEGTEVRIILPSVVPAQPRAPLPQPGAPRSKLSILVVDDEALVAGVMERVLSRAGHSVVRASNAATAFESLDKSAYDLVITDVLLGAGPTGLEVAHYAQRVWPGTPVLLVSGYTERALDDDGSLPLLTKPFRPKQLLAMVDQLIEVRQAG